VELVGEIERITYTNEENGFTVARVRVRGYKELICVVGAMLEPQAGLGIKARGEWRNDPKYGRQFVANQCWSILPATTAGLKLYLQSGLIKGIGKSYAERIVNHFGPQTFEILDQNPDRLSEVSGIGKKKLEQIKKGWAAHRDIRELMIFLQTHGVSSAYAVRLFKHYGDTALSVVRENPYRTAMEVHGIGFLTADLLAGKLGFARDCDLRVEAGIIYVMNQVAEQGHVFFPRDELVAKCVEILEVRPDQVEVGIRGLAETRRIRLDEIEPGRQAVYLTPFFLAEEGVAKRLRNLLAAPKTVRPIGADEAVELVQKELGIQLGCKQIEAVRLAATHKALVVTGGPGTGKTTTINAILKLFRGLAGKIALAAPTGRAAKRMTEATGFEAKTIHRLLEFSPQDADFKRNETNPLPCSLLIVDEASMIDVLLMNRLLKSVPLGATIALVGDVNQLPSVGPGNVLKDIIYSEVVPVIELDQIFRQAAESRIITNAHAINQGRLPYIESERDRLTDFYFIRREEPAQAVDMIVDLVKNHIPRRFGFDPIDEIQVLTPMHKGEAGAANLNIRLQDALNPETSGLTRGGRLYKLGDKVMQIRNNYDKDIFNGDIGRIVGLDAEEKKLVVRIDERDVEFEDADLDELMPAYAISIHKSQGSEYPAVVIPVLTQHYVLLQRNLIYTAVTRGKKLVVLVGTKRALGIAVRNNATQKRYTWLEQRLSGGRADSLVRPRFEACDGRTLPL
jgi:exodeoxyribonuclease V alpha subunit